MILWMRIARFLRDFNREWKQIQKKRVKVKMKMKWIENNSSRNTRKIIQLIILIMTIFFKSYIIIRMYVMLYPLSISGYYINQCYKHDNNVDSCLQKSINHLISHIKDGIPELRLTRPEPIIIDEIHLALGSGPNGYRAKFLNIEAYGVSNITVTNVR